MNAGGRLGEAPTLETERLILRAPRLEDFEAHAAFYGDEEATRFIGGVKSRAQAWRHFTEAAGDWSLHGFDKFVVVEKATGRWVGRVGPKHIFDIENLEVGWNIAREFWRRGYAREAAAAAIDFVFSLGEVRVVHCIDPNNEASRRLAAQLGSKVYDTRVAISDAALPMDIWELKATDWRA